MVFRRVVFLVHFYFIICTNDLPNAITHSDCILFADDTTLYLSSNNLINLCECIEHDMNALFDWFCANNLSLNVSKTMFVLFKPKRVPKGCDINRLVLGSETIERVRCTKYLGIYMYVAKLHYSYYVG